MSAQTQLLEMIQSGQAYPASVLMPLYEQLEGTSAEFMIGTWKGGKFDGGKEPDPIKWYGKRFVSSTHVEPLLCRRDDGSVYSYENLGVAQLREMVFGGKVCASLIYDKQPIMDYFRKVTDDLVVGRGETKGTDDDLFFHLTRE